MYELAYNLRKTVSEIEDMDYTEYLGWVDYFERRPVGWREDNRVMPLLQIKGLKAAPQEIFPSLAAMMKAERQRETAQANNTAKGLENSAFFMQLLGATGGDHLPGLAPSNG